jgi:hypothetical protein
MHTESNLEHEMSENRHRLVMASFLVGSAMAVLSAAPVSAALTHYRGVETQSAWESVTGSWDTLDFTGFQPGQHLTDEYEAEFGVVFTDTTHQVFLEDHEGFPNDGWGLKTGTFAQYIQFDLADPIDAIAFFHPGSLSITLWLGDELVGQGGDYFAGYGNFYGITSTTPFDRVRIDDEAGIGFVDDIRLGMAVPGPGALATLAVGLFGSGRRRRLTR